MALGFGSTFGTSGTTDVVTGGTNITAGTTMSYFSWCWRNGFGPSGFGALFSISDGATQKVGIGQNGDSANMYFQRAWTAGGIWTWANPTGSKWFSLGITYDGGSTANVPIVYVNGASVSVSTLSAPTGALVAVSQPPRIGNAPTPVAFDWDGMIAEQALWNGAILTTNEMLSLSTGTLPFNIRNAGLTLYCPLLGTQANEPDWGPNHQVMTVTGAKFQPHAPVRNLNSLLTGT